MNRIPAAQANKAENDFGGDAGSDDWGEADLDSENDDEAW